MNLDFKLPNLELIAQGAEGRVYECLFLGRPCIIKQRFSKRYRHPLLDSRITQRRLQQECRMFVRCQKAGIDVPAVYFVDEPKTAIFMERIHGLTLKETIFQGKESADMFSQVGSVLAALHDIDLVHGDLTTSNLMIRDGETSVHGHFSQPHLNQHRHTLQQHQPHQPHHEHHPLQQSQSVVLLDFGLSYSSTLPEDKAVDLYVLERAFLSTHPDSQRFVDLILAAYRSKSKKAATVLAKLEQVRLRGRKRTMIG
nr:EKC/KEOPS complex subunit TP53RK [Andalucia godoyi]|eukprot:ANDGO_03298.mRNA.1 EKC/KEOPS complex subunit bud32